MKKQFNIADLKSRFATYTEISKAELFAYFHREKPDLSESAFKWRIYDLKQKGVLQTVGAGLYTLKAKPDFIPQISTRTKRIFHRLKMNFPLVKLSLWETRWLNSLMIHLPGRYMLIVEVERGVEESVFYHLKTKEKNVFLQPSAKDMEQYILDTKESLVVRTLPGRCPLIKVENVTIPRLEKILVDLYCDKNLYIAFQGSELANIFSFAIKNYHLNFTTLENYAGRKARLNSLVSYLQKAGIMYQKSTYPKIR